MTHVGTPQSVWGERDDGTRLTPVLSPPCKEPVGLPMKNMWRFRRARNEAAARGGAAPVQPLDSGGPASRTRPLATRSWSGRSGGTESRSGGGDARGDPSRSGVPDRSEPRTSVMRLADMVRATWIRCDSRLSGRKEGDHILSLAFASFCGARTRQGSRIPHAPARYRALRRNRPQAEQVQARLPTCRRA